MTDNETGAVVDNKPAVDAHDNGTADLTQEQINWRKVREEKERYRREKEEGDRRQAELDRQNEALKTALESVLNKVQPSQGVQEPVGRALPRDQFVTGEDVEEYLKGSVDPVLDRKIEAMLDKRDRQREEQRRQQEQADMPKRLKAEHRDFDEICTQENLDYLEYHHPELSKSMARVPDSIDKWKDIYAAVKRYVPNANSSRDQKRAEVNLQKPRSSSTPGVATGSSESSTYLSQDRKQANYERMVKQMRGG